MSSTLKPKAPSTLKAQPLSTSKAQPPSTLGCFSCPARWSRRAFHAQHVEGAATQHPEAFCDAQHVGVLFMSSTLKPQPSNTFRGFSQPARRRRNCPVLWGEVAER